VNLITDPVSDVWKYLDTRVGDDFDEKKDFSAKDFNTYKNIPFLGKHYYWLLGGGRTKQVNKDEKRENEEYKKYAKLLYVPGRTEDDVKKYEMWYIKLDDVRKGEFAAYASRWFSRNKKKPAMQRMMEEDE
jgi:hypothetical protein